MKTTDNYELKINGMYYLETGQEVYLFDYMKTKDGKMKYLVAPFYEGEAMEVSGDGGEHHEITMNYTHEADPILVEKIFEKEPVEKLGEQYKNLLEKITSLSVLSNNLEKEINNKAKEKYHLERDLPKLNERFSKLLKVFSDKTEELKEVQEKLYSKQKRLDALKNVPENKKDEYLEYLKKRNFKLTCLEDGGVDNWEWYGISLEEYNKIYDN